MLDGQQTGPSSCVTAIGTLQACTKARCGTTSSEIAHYEEFVCRTAHLNRLVAGGHPSACGGMATKRPAVACLPNCRSRMRIHETAHRSIWHKSTHYAQPRLILADNTGLLLANQFDIGSFFTDGAKRGHNIERRKSKTREQNYLSVNGDRSG